MNSVFERFINDFVIPQNWEILSNRFAVEFFTAHDQRMKIIGEIVEFHEAICEYKEQCNKLVFAEVVTELADIVISTCTMLSILDRKYRNYNEPFLPETEIWISLVIGRCFDKLITTAQEYAAFYMIDLEKAIRQKLEYNRTRPDWV